MFVKAGQFLCKQLVKNMWNSEKGSPIPHDFHVAVFFKRERARNFGSRNDNEKNSLMFRYTCLMFWGVPAYSWPPSAEEGGGLSGAPGLPPPGGGATGACAGRWKESAGGADRKWTGAPAYCCTGACGTRLLCGRTRLGDAQSILLPLASMIW